MELSEEEGVGGAVAARFRRLPELFLRRVSVHGAQFEKAIYGKEHRKRTGQEPNFILYN